MFFLPWSVSDHQKMVLNAQTYNWDGMGLDGPLNASLLRAPLCGADNEILMSSLLGERHKRLQR